MLPTDLTLFFCLNSIGKEKCERRLKIKLTSDKLIKLSKFPRLI